MNNVIIKYKENYYENLNSGFSITRQRSDFRRLQDRQTLYTSEFKLPMIKDFYSLRNLSSVNFNLLNRFLKVDIFVNGMQIFSNVNASIKAIDLKEKTFTLNIYGNEFDFINAIKNVRVRDLNLDVLTHEITPENFANNLFNDWTDGFTYALADFGNFKNADNKVLTDYQLPFVYVKWLWQKMLEYTGFTCEWQPDENLVISGKRGWKKEDGVVSSFDYDYTPTFILPNGISGTEKITLTPDGNLESINPDGYTFKAPDDGYYILSWQLDFNTDGNLYVDYYDVIKNETENLARILPNKTYLGNGQHNYWVNFAVEFYLEKNDEIKIYVTGYTGECERRDEYTDDEDCPTDHVSLNSNEMHFKTSDSQTAKYLASEFIGDLKLYDFFKDLLNFYGLTFWLEGNEIKIKEWQAIFDNKIDYDFRLIELSNVRRLPKDYAQANTLEYLYQNNEDIKMADASLNINNEVLPESKTLFKRPYQFAPASNYRLGNNQLLSLAFWTPTFNDDGTIKEWKPQSQKMAIGYLVDDATEFDYGTSIGDTYTYDDDSHFFQNENLKWGLNKWRYATIEKSLNNYTEIEIKVSMSVLEYINLDLGGIYYIPHYAMWIYINSIKFKNNEVIINGIKIIQ